MRNIAIVGTGFVADLYAASLKTFPRIRVVACYDIEPARLARFCAHWGLPAVDSFAALVAAGPEAVLNLTNPHAHAEVNRACLTAGLHVYCEKPLATGLADAEALVRLAVDKGLQLASAPCSLLGTTAQTARRALAAGAIGTPRLVYAELDDDFISQAPLHRWHSESGTPWPVADELRVGCTLEHAGYYLTWLMAMFGPVAGVSAASAKVTDTGHLIDGGAAPDYSAATLFFEGGMVARLTCSIVAPHDHRLRIFGDGGVMAVGECWDNLAPVRTRRRHVIRRRLVTSPFPRTARPLAGERHPTVKRRGAASMNFALGPAELLAAIATGTPSRQAGGFALHLTEVTLAIQDSGRDGGATAIASRFDPPPPADWPAILALL